MNIKKILINTIGIFILCSIIHFGYSTFPNFFTSIFFPVNESIWEHLKMIFSSTVIYTLIRRIFVNDQAFLIEAYLKSMLTIIILLIIYLPVNYMLGEILILTMIILLISIFISEVIVSKLPLKKHHKTLNIIGAILIIINFIVFTYLSYNPIKVGLLYDKPSDKYGIDTLNKWIS